MGKALTCIEYESVWRKHTKNILKTCNLSWIPLSTLTFMINFSVSHYFDIHHHLTVASDCMKGKGLQNRQIPVYSLPFNFHQM